MKTTNKIRRTALTAALAVGFSIFGFSINTQIENKFLPENNPANNLAMITVERGNHYFTSTFNANNSKTGNAFTVYSEKETEVPLNLERWMLDDSNFSSATSIESENEIPLEIETWMIDDKTFTGNSVAIETATDEEMEIENWMLDENKFEISNNKVIRNISVQSEKYIFISNISFPAVITEKSLQLEDWMTNSKIWK